MEEMWIDTFVKIMTKKIYCRGQIGKDQRLESKWSRIALKTLTVEGPQHFRNDHLQHSSAQRHSIAGKYD